MSAAPILRQCAYYRRSHKRPHAGRGQHKGRTGVRARFVTHRDQALLRRLQPRPIPSCLRRSLWQSARITVPCQSGALGRRLRRAGELPNRRHLRPRPPPNARAFTTGCALIPIGSRRAPELRWPTDGSDPVSTAAASASNSSCRATERNDIGHCWFAFGQRARLIETGNSRLAHVLQHRAALDQKAARAPADRLAAIAAGTEMTSAQGQLSAESRGPCRPTRPMRRRRGAAARWRQLPLPQSPPACSSARTGRSAARSALVPALPPPASRRARWCCLMPLQSRAGAARRRRLQCPQRLDRPDPCGRERSRRLPAPR